MVFAWHSNTKELLFQELAERTNDTNMTKDTTTLHKLAKNGNVKGAARLLKRGKITSVSPADILGSTPLHIAAENGKTDFIDWLLDNGAEMNAKDINGMTVQFLYF